VPPASGDPPRTQPLQLALAVVRTRGQHLDPAPRTLGSTL
jgi:hypothetical protein